MPLPSPPRRIVSLVPSLTEAVEVTAPGLIVGATDYCTYPPTLEIQRVGGSKFPSVERILALRPDLVIANAEENRRADVAELSAAGIAVWTTTAAATVPAALASMRRLFADALDLGTPGWLTAADRIWAEPTPVGAQAIVPVWRRPWVVLGRDTFAGDVLRRIGIGNTYGGDTERYPRPPLGDLLGRLARGDADLVVLPDEPYEFTTADGPEAFPGARCVLIPGRPLTWYGPSLVTARKILTDILSR